MCIQYIPCIYSETSIWNHPASTDEVELRSSLHSLEGAKEQATQATLSFFGAICSTHNAGVIPCDLKTCVQNLQANEIQHLAMFRKFALENGGDTIFLTVFFSAENNPPQKINKICTTWGTFQSPFSVVGYLQTDWKCLSRCLMTLKNSTTVNQCDVSYTVVIISDH